MQAATTVLNAPTKPWVLPDSEQTFDLPTDEDGHAPCGTWHISGDPLTGKPIKYQQFCEHWRNRECPACFVRRVNKFRSRICKAYLELGEEEFNVVLLSEEDASELARKCSRNDSLYYRCPTSLYDYVIFQPFLDCPESDIPWRSLDWEELANTPKGRRPSGKLGAPKKVVVDPNAYVAEVLTIEYDAPTSIVLEAWKRAIEQTKDLNPANPEQAETAINERLNYVAFWVAELGGKVLKSYYRNVRISENSVLSWSYKETVSGLLSLAKHDSSDLDGREDPDVPF